MSLPPEAFDFKLYLLYGVALSVPPLVTFYPFRLLKTLQQHSTELNPRIFSLAKSVVHSDGFTGLYKGASMFVMGMVSARLFQFGTYDIVREHARSLQQFQSIPRAASDLVAAGVSGTAMAVVMTPFDVIAQRRSVNRRVSNKEISQNIWKNEGFLGFFRGYGITATAVIPYSICFFWYI